MQLQANAQMNIPVSCMNDWTIENSCLLISVHKDSPPYNKKNMYLWHESDVVVEIKEKKCFYCSINIILTGKEKAICIFR